MGRRYEIGCAFDAAVKIESNGRRTVTTSDFVAQLKKVNYEWSCRKTNRWIEMSVSTFRDVSTTEGENRTFMLFNPNGGH